ncbi:MAG: methylmalonyl-CoA epimerase [Candidatus Edwardsbacteria bacterium RIFOXYD12_FULL_50_11]|uniref:Methylmalonyl-CoA epimerase n=1 Tax=Candidatus Edwardsbacteria bacterium GWF2_54_11 TaxID=1817851 RepID=A0A1F5RHB8_9BACT|nr:MAG: methylmalonyl-CoA epimerase [Candidatus Edwardsbacteria bacterium RifOxyC12_full_54_24]OGF07290.1 MAG: methylmalonyl-CoA epimerase [Candidatus Edwardsbacteria bacterium RifOxyA12_full_54_48]OGF09544.1 MAG: methylmalonyl-CoA epimerase [Candidatus Edwardsbacteria bacterium GWE2_54_12]OGF13788.1 MAG: methylmalonyl-CoA epimerase [Candidatus Edwardsbacteria bacterium GWF2_54_11]OGF17192.1 MAG: methylmalonyl-CoA epimerase [Candidatus Edwardsbacteria bacterium RIFOXYD12_FULL_50_11]OGJ19771.1 
MHIKGIDHIGIAVKNLEEAQKFYTEGLGLALEAIETVESQKVKVAFIPVGDSRVELLESTAPDGNIAKFIEAKGEGIHHLALKVDNIEKALEELTAKGYQLIDKVPRVGAGGHRIAFVHPKSTKGVLLELSEGH